MDVDQLLSSNLGGLSLQPNQKKTATQDPPGSTDNGKFDLLPTEITSYKLTYLALDDLSWCGTHTDMLVSSSLIELVSAPTLTRLEMSSCALTDKAFTQIARRCHNLQYLDISATYQYLSVKSIQMISFLSELTW